MSILTKEDQLDISELSFMDACKTGNLDIISYLLTSPNSKHADITVMSAAVADFKPLKKEKEKIKKKNVQGKIELIPTKDILSELGKRKNGSLLVGFALFASSSPRPVLPHFLMYLVCLFIRFPVFFPCAVAMEVL